MNSRDTWSVAALIVLAAGVWYLWTLYQAPLQPSQPAHTATTTAPAPQLSSALYPLYGNAHWGAVAAESFLIGTTSYAGTSIASAPINAGMNPGSVITPFERYYDTKLKDAGYAVAQELAAGGHVGGQTGYRKGDSVILTRFSITYHTTPANAPSECPCDVSLSLFSGH